MVAGNQNTLRTNTGVIANRDTTTAINKRLRINADILTNRHLATKAFDITAFTNKTVICNF